MQGLIDKAASPRRFVVVLLGGFAAFAVVLDRWIFTLPSFEILGVNVSLFEQGSVSLVGPNLFGWQLDSTAEVTVFASVCLALAGLAWVVSMATEQVGEHFGPAITGTLQSTVGIGPRRMPNLYGIFFTLTPTNRLAITLTIAASLLLLAWAATRKPSLPLALLVAILVSYHLYPCDLTLLLLPISLLCDRLFAEDSASRAPSTTQRHRRTILFCAMGVFLISPMFVWLFERLGSSALAVMFVSRSKPAIV